jgi:DNA ligase-1
MKAFAQLFLSLDETNKTNEKVKVLKDYFNSVPDTDKMHMLALFTGRKPKRIINATQVRTWATEITNIPIWLFEESYSVVGDLAETIALLMPQNTTSISSKTLTDWIGELNELAIKTEEERKLWLTDSWAMLDTQELFVFNKLLTGSFRVGVSQSLVIKALADITKLDAATLTHRIMGNWIKNKALRTIYRAPTLSFWPIPYKRPRKNKNRQTTLKLLWAMPKIGKPSGSGTASVHN